MIDYEAPSTAAVLPLVTDATTRRLLLRIAYWSTRSRADAEDLVADACVRMLDPEDRPWKREERSFMVHMTLLMRQHWHQTKRRMSFGNESADGGVAQETTASEHEPLDDQLERARTLDVQRALGQRVMSRLAGRARDLFELCSEHDLTRAEQATHLGCTPQEIKAAHEQIGYHAKAVRSEWEDTAKLRMKHARGEARNMSEDSAP